MAGSASSCAQPLAPSLCAVSPIGTLGGGAAGFGALFPTPFFFFSFFF